MKSVNRLFFNFCRSVRNFFCRPLSRSPICRAAITHNVFGLCVRWGFPALKLNSSTNFNLSTND